MSASIGPKAWLEASGAQRDVVDGLSRCEDWNALFRTCPRGDWLLGIAERLGAPHEALVRAAVACARIVDHDEPATKLLHAAERWLEDASAHSAALAEQTRALEAVLAGAADPASEAAGRAALAVGLGAMDRTILPAAPAAAVESVMIGSIDCGFELAMRWGHDRCAAAVRSAVPWPMFEACIARLGGTP